MDPRRSEPKDFRRARAKDTRAHFRLRATHSAGNSRFRK